VCAPTLEGFTKKRRRRRRRWQPSWISDRNKNPNFLEDIQMIIPGQFGFNCPSGLREEAF